MAGMASRSGLGEGRIGPFDRCADAQEPRWRPAACANISVRDLYCDLRVSADVPQPRVGHDV
eukprot:6472498-Prymnesium_polylepis.1